MHPQPPAQRPQQPLQQPPPPSPYYQQPQQQPPPSPYYQQPAPARAPTFIPASEVEVVEEFEPIDEEISEEEYRREKRQLRRRRAVGMVGATVMGILAAIIVFALLFNSNIIPSIYDNFVPTELESNNLVAPSIPTWAPEFGDEPPVATGPDDTADALYTITWLTTNIFAGRGGTMRINITNNGLNDIYIESVRFMPEWGDPLDWYATSIGRFIAPGDEVPIGLLGFPGPSVDGTYDYNFEVDLMAKRPLLGTWSDISPKVNTNTFYMEVLPATPVSGYPQHTNDKDVYRKVNDLIVPDDPRVAQVANEVRAGLGNEYNIYWVAALFDWVIEELDYKPDPSDDDVWSPAGETCDSLTGDCEDYSILISSVIEHWGGNSRFYIITGHAFAAVYVGGPQMETLSVANALNDYYGTSTRYSWFKDDLGYWIIADGTSSQFLGGLPYGGVAVDTQGGWDIEGTEYLYITDIYPGYPE